MTRQTLLKRALISITPHPQGWRVSGICTCALRSDALEMAARVAISRGVFTREEWEAATK